MQSLGGRREIKRDRNPDDNGENLCSKKEY